MSWAVAIIEPNRDEEAERALKRHGFRVVFLYWQRLLLGHRGRWRTACDFVPTPLFPGYGFVELHPDQAWPQTTMARVASGPRVAGFMGLVRVGLEPLWIDYETVWAWREMLRAGVFDDKRPEPKGNSKAKFAPANSEEERRRVLAEFQARMFPQHAAAS